MINPNDFLIKISESVWKQPKTSNILFFCKEYEKFGVFESFIIME
jgi:hypothetical protein